MVATGNRAAVESDQDQFIEGLAWPVRCRESILIPRQIDFILVDSLAFPAGYFNPMPLRLLAPEQTRLVEFVLEILTGDVTQKKDIVGLRCECQSKALNAR